MQRMLRVTDIFIGIIESSKPTGPSRESVKVRLENGATGLGWTVQDALLAAYRTTASDQSNSGPSTA